MLPIQDIRKTGGPSNEMSPNDLLPTRGFIPFYRIIFFVEFSKAHTEIVDAALSSWCLFTEDLVGLRTKVITKSPCIIGL